MLTPFDDYPIHQTPLPVAHPASGDRNHYDRYFFNGYDTSGEWFFAFALGVYPNRDVIDGAFSVLHAGVQRSVFASGRAPMDRTRTRIGPISVEVLEPLRQSRVTVDAPEFGVGAELLWEPRTMAFEEPRQTMLAGTDIVMDATRLVQFGRWTGTIDAGAERIAIDPSRSLGTKDRSWGVRWVGEPPGGAPPITGTAPGVVYLWSVLQFDDRCVHGILFERPDGHRWYTSAGEIPLLSPGGRTWGDESGIRRARSVGYRLDLRAGTRRTRRSTLEFAFADGVSTLELEPMLDFQLKGIGYMNQKWTHGVWHGEEEVGGDMWEAASLDPLAPENLLVEQACRVHSERGDGVGVLEQLILGVHAPTGFGDWTSGAPG